MSAPSGTEWGSIVTGSGSGNYRKGRIGIYATTSNTDTITTINVQVWFWTIYSCSDGSNNIYFDIGGGVTEATTYVGSASVYHSVDSGSGWSTSNQTLLLSKSYGYKRASGSQTCNLYAKFNGIDLISGGTMYANTSVTIPALTSYTISYNANGGSGAPGSQTKYYGQTLTLSSTKPTRTGYTFKGWSASSSATTASWSAGGSYADNASKTLYAVWEAVKYTISYNANGGSGAPGSQTKTYGQTLTLSSTVPTKTNYNFKGWSTSSSATSATYSAGGSYTSNESATLYAVWEIAYVAPRINNFTAYRVNDDWVADDNGTLCACGLIWSTDNEPATVTFSFKEKSASAWTADITLNPSGKSGVIQEEILNGELDVDNSYDIKVTVSDSSGSSEATYRLASTPYAIDFLAGGTGVAIGKVAEKTGFEVAMDAEFTRNVTLKAIADLLSNADKVVVIDANNKVCYRTVSELKNDLSVDYIVEQGTSGKWTYRKWNSGIGECWGIFATDGITPSTAWGSSMVYGTWMNTTVNKTARKYPFAFTEVPVVQVSLNPDSGDGWLISDCNNNYGTLKTYAPAYAVARPYSGGITMPRISYYVIGKWK